MAGTFDYGSQKSGGETFSIERLVPLLYDDLRSLARRRMRSEPPGHTLQATALVHEAYLRLLNNGAVTWNSPAHFYCAAAEAMRRILVERARRRRRMRHGAGLARVPFDDIDIVTGYNAPDVLALNDAIERLHALDARKSRIVMLRYFTGLTIAETADVLGISPTTVKDDWTYARAWLQSILTGERPSAKAGGVRTGRHRETR
jgi:RNA polymerase sigma factor (TIGR02999 family)